MDRKGAQGSDEDRSPVKAREPKCPKSDCPYVSTGAGQGYTGAGEKWSEKEGIVEKVTRGDGRIR
jgi:hypothetical protein